MKIRLTCHDRAEMEKEGLHSGVELKVGPNLLSLGVQLAVRVLEGVQFHAEGTLGDDVQSHGLEDGLHIDKGAGPDHLAQVGDHVVHGAAEEAQHAYIFIVIFNYRKYAYTIQNSKEQRDNIHIQAFVTCK